MVIVCDLFYQTNDGGCPKKYLTPCSWHFYLQMKRKNLKEKKKKKEKCGKWVLLFVISFFYSLFPPTEHPLMLILMIVVASGLSTGMGVA